MIASLSVRITYPARALLAATALSTLATAPAWAEVAVLSRSSGVGFMGQLQSTTGGGATSFAPVPGIGTPPGEFFDESVDDPTPPAFDVYSTGAVMRQGEISVVSGIGPTARPGISVQGTGALTDRRLLDGGGQTVGFRALGNIQTTGSITAASPGNPGSANGFIDGNSFSYWTFSLDQEYRYYVRGNANFIAFNPPGGSSTGTIASFAFYEIDPGSNEILGIVDEASGGSSLTPTFTSTGLLLPGTYLVEMSGGAGGGMQQLSNTLANPDHVTAVMNWGIDVSLAATEAASVIVGVQERAGYADITATPSGTTTSATLLDGVSGGSRTVSLSVLTGQSDPAIIGAPVELTGTAGDLVVLQLTYDDSLVADETLLRLGWINGLDEWVNAIDGNSDGGAGGEAAFFVGAYDPLLHFQLSAHGVDPVNNVVWAVIDHNSTFGVQAVPEPTTLSLLGLGASALLRCRPARVASGRSGRRR